MRTAAPRVVLADTPYLACAAGARVGVPTVGLTNLTWSEILADYEPTGSSERLRLLGQIDQSYGSADFALRIAPGLALRPFKAVHDIGPIAQPAKDRRADVRRQLNLTPSDRLVLVGFGGIPLSNLPFERMERMTGYSFLVDGTVVKRSPRIRNLATLPFPFATLLASCDLIMTKPGYGTTVEAVTLGIPVVYVRRHNFADEHPLVDYLTDYGRSCELLQDDFAAGRWEPALNQAWSSTQRHPPPACTGAADAARHLVKFF